MDSSQASFQFYSEGIYSDPACSNTSTTHGIAVIGWGVEASSNAEYWLLKVLRINW